MTEPNFSTTRTQYVFDTTNLKYKSRSEVFALQRKWNTFEQVENYNDIIYQRFQIGYRDKTYYQFTSNQEYNDYKAGQELHILKFASTLPASTFASISSRPMPEVAIQRTPPHYIGSGQFLTSPTPIASETTTNRAEMAMYTYVSTYNATHHYQYSFTTNEEQLAYNRIQRQVTMVELQAELQRQAVIKEQERQRLEAERLEMERRRFLPTRILGLQVWYDGEDPSGNGTIPAEGAPVYVWVNKSQYKEYIAYALTTNGNVPVTYSADLKALVFNGNNIYNTGYTSRPTSETIFVVFNNNVSIYNITVIGGPSGGRGMGCGGSGNGANTCGMVNMNVAWQANTPVGTYTSGTTALTTGIVNNNTTNISINGGTVYSSSVGLPYTATTPMVLGGQIDPANTYMYEGYVMEIVIYNSVLTTSQIQQMEGYLAWKWGFQTSLPETHPYSKARPIV